MIDTFFLGCFLGLATFVYIGPVHRYRNLPREPRESRHERVERALEGLDPDRVVLLVLASGVLCTVLWHGLADILSMAGDVIQEGSR